MLEIGSQIDRFIVEQEIGSGGMATVFRARHVSLGTLHAIKILSGDLAKDSDLRQRFLAEGRIQARLNHPNIVRVTDTVEAGEVAGLVMDLVDGETLSRFVKSFDGPPDAQTIREVFLQVLAGVGYAHKNGVIHRDLKPSNILVEDREGEPLLARVLDFGIAKAMEAEEGVSLTRTGTMLGTPAYMSPEQVINARHVTPRSDIFSLGAVLYAFATRRKPFEGNTEYVLMRNIERCSFLPAHEANPAIDPTISHAITRAMLAEPSQRFASCEEFAEALGGRKRAPTAARRPSTPPPPAPRPAPSVSQDTAINLELGQGPDDDTPTDFVAKKPVRPPAPIAPRTAAKSVQKSSISNSATRARSGPASPPRNAPPVAPRNGPVELAMEVEEPYQETEIVTEEVVVRTKTLFKAAVTKTVERHQQVTKTRVVKKKAAIPFVTVDPGQFTMGSPSDETGRSEDEVEHEVIITRPFLVQATLVTQAQWSALMPKNPSGFKGLSHPVEMVTWYDAIAYCNALSERLRMEPSYLLSAVQGKPGEEGFSFKAKWKGLGVGGFRLLTESEWEFACRAGSGGARYGELDDIAWWGGNSGNQTNDVAAKAPNAFGLHDMIGLCWEWVWDTMGAYPPGPLADPIGPDAGKERVWRGGCWGSDVENCRAAKRSSKPPHLRPFTTGFRLARTLTNSEM